MLYTSIIMDTNILDKLNDMAKNKAKINFNPEQIVKGLLALISQREAKILTLRYGFESEKGMTLDAIGKLFNLTRERVRQLENQAVKNITKSNKYEEIVSPFSRLIIDLVSEHGGVVSEEFLITRLKELSANDKQTIAHIKFLLANFLFGLEKVEHSDFKPGWKSLDITFDLVMEIILTLEKILIDNQKIMPEEELIEHFKKTSYYQEKMNQVNELLQKSNSNLNYILNAYLHASKKFSATPFKQWGLSSWEHASPKRINGKIYLVMLHQQKPLHFTEIADIINGHWPEGRQVKTATVHNELIFDSRFVLVGRGVYGLKEWGYTEGNVKKVVAEVIKEKGALTEAEIIKIVSEKKMVKPATIKLALKDLNIFDKKDNKYSVK